MGCVSSKGFRRNPDRVRWYSRLSRNVSAASTNQQRFERDEQFISMVPYEDLNTETLKGSLLNMGSKAKCYKTINLQAELEESFTFTSHLEAKQKDTCGGMKPRLCKEERKSLLMPHAGSDGYMHMCNLSKCSDVEVIDAGELMEGLEGSAKDTSSPLRIRSCGKLSIPTNKQLSFCKLQGSINDPMGEIDSPVWKKYYMQEDELVGMDFTFDQNLHTPPMGSPFRESPRRVYTHPTSSPFSESPRWAHTPPSGSPFSRSPRRAPSRGSLMDREDARSVSSVELLDASTIGLKFLLSPANSSFHPSPVTQREGPHSASRRSFDGNTGSLRNACANLDINYGHVHVDFDDAKSPYRSPVTTRHSSKKPSTESVYGCGSPLFDPSLMATFEEALKTTTEATGYDEWLQSSTDGSNVSSMDTRATFETISDAESLPSWQNRETSSSEVVPIDKTEVKKKKDLASYDLRCPPRGEGKVVLYFTSLRGVRKTYEDCFNVRLILRGIGAQVDERDVWMHANFKTEIMDLLSGSAKGVPPQVPQLFIKGRYIGGAEEVQQLHEDGILACLMDGMALGVIHKVCDGCGDARFLPCLTCSGSRKVLDEEEYEVLQCPDCNENGLIMCPMCIM